MSKKAARRGRPPVYRDKIAALKRKSSIYFADASMDSVKSIASHLGRALGRQFTTRQEENGVLVARET